MDPLHCLGCTYVSRTLTILLSFLAIASLRRCLYICANPSFRLHRCLYIRVNPSVRLFVWYFSFSDLWCLNCTCQDSPFCLMGRRTLFYRLQLTFKLLEISAHKWQNSQPDEVSHSQPSQTWSWRKSPLPMPITSTSPISSSLLIGSKSRIEVPLTTCSTFWRLNLPGS